MCTVNLRSYLDPRQSSSVGASGSLGVAPGMLWAGGQVTYRGSQFSQHAGSLLAIVTGVMLSARALAHGGDFAVQKVTHTEAETIINLLRPDGGRHD